MSKNFLKAILAPIGKGLLIFAVFGAALYAYASVTFPGSSPAAPSGVLGMYVGSSADVTGSAVDGDPGNYTAANAQCDEYDDTHVCTIAEMVNSYNNTAPALPNNGVVWVTNGPTFSGAYVANDCQGWTTADGSDLGSVWFFAAGNGYSGITPCSLSYEFACCK